MSKFKSIIKKGVTMSQVGIDPYLEGKKNFENPCQEYENIAKNRTFVCIRCPHFVKEPIDFLQVIDKRIPELSKMMCDDCGCTASYKLRQNVKTCSKWMEKQ